jgi:hypothetical protein
LDRRRGVSFHPAPTIALGNDCAALSDCRIRLPAALLVAADRVLQCATSTSSTPRARECSSCLKGAARSALARALTALGAFVRSRGVASAVMGVVGEDRVDLVASYGGFGCPAVEVPDERDQRLP